MSEENKNSEPEQQSEKIPEGYVAAKEAQQKMLQEGKTPGCKKSTFNSNNCRLNFLNFHSIITIISNNKTHCWIHR